MTRRFSGAPRSWSLAMLALAAASACGGTAPPSRFPDAEVALERMRHSQMCSRGVQGEAKIDYFGEEGRVKGSVLYKAALPDQVRLDLFSPFGVILSTLTSDGTDFAWFDLRQKTFLQGAAKACNLQRFLHVPVPPHALVQLLRGEAPVLVHEPGAATIEWQSRWFGKGRYIVRVPSRHGAVETIELVPRPQDWARGYREQVLRVLGVEVMQRGHVLYRVELTGHRAAATAAPQTDPDFPGVTLKPSGPSCRAELPGRLRFEVPSTDRDVVFTNMEVVHNPPIGKTGFEQPIPSGVSVRNVVCRD